MNTKQLVLELKENNQDFEFYPTTKAMLDVVYRYITRGKTILDIGCGNGTFKNYLKDIGKDDDFDYFAIEKSEILLNQLPADVYVLGTDFNQCTLIDKKVDIIFCNPPYSEYEKWACRIIREGYFKDAFLIIPERWKENENIKQAIKDANVTTQVLSSQDFLNAERQARAKIDIVKIVKNREYQKENDPFDLWFENTFNFKAEKSYVREYEENDKKKEYIRNQVVSANDKIESLVNLYNNEMNRLYDSFKAICALDEETLKDIGVATGKVKEALKYKISNTKILYWRLVFEYLDEITTRLTAASREKLFDKFNRINEVDFNYSNIKSVVIWVLKNASSLFNEQLIELYKTFTSPDNIIKYKSNQRVFKRDDWYNKRFDREEVLSHYCLSYRMVVDRLYFTDYSYFSKDYTLNERKIQTIVDDLCAIAYNLGFVVMDKDKPELFGEKYYIKGINGKPIIEYKLYKNGNTHIKLDIEFAKALNVEVSRLLGWIRNKSDIAKDFPDEMAKDAEKYFGKQFMYSLNKPNVLLLTAKGA